MRVNIKDLRDANYVVNCCDNRVLEIDENEIKPLTYRQPVIMYDPADMEYIINEVLYRDTIYGRNLVKNREIHSWDFKYMGKAVDKLLFKCIVLNDTVEA